MYRVEPIKESFDNVMRTSLFADATSPPSFRG
jgi:hypothetical protein